MTLFLVFFLSFLVVGEVNNTTDKIQEKKETEQVVPNKVSEKQSTDLKAKTKKPELIKEEIKTEIKELKPEPIKEEIKPEIKELKPEPIKEEIKPELAKEEVKEIDGSVETETSWLKLILYILSPILIILIGKNLYSRLKNNSTSNNVNDYMRKEFKDEVQPDTAEQEPTTDEAQPDTAEQEPTEEDENNNKQ